jgi:uncharacterized membrane protein YbaN (DUF454 family)
MLTDTLAPCGLDNLEPAPVQEPIVVHSSYGRLRVHLPHWSCTREDDLAAVVSHLSGVTYAEANPLTGNLLILFDPEQTSKEALLDALPLIRPVQQLPQLEVYYPNEAAEAIAAPDEPRPLGYVTGVRRFVYKILGWTSVGLAVVGAITPGIPTAPFVILAGYFFIRSSPEAHQWLRNSRWFGTMLRDWEEHRGIRRSVRNVAVGLIGASMLLTPLLGLPVPVLATILVCQVIGLTIVLRIKVIDPVTSEPSTSAPALALQAQAP